jgi:hypothetical protein
MPIELNAGETKRLDIELIPVIGGIRGYIINYNTSGHVPGAKMVVDNQLTVYSQDDGSYSISGLSYGRHYIVIEAEGYRTVTFHVDVSQEIQNVDFQLVPIGYGGEILEFNIEPTQIYQQDEITIQCKIENTGDVGELLYARIHVNGQWAGSIIGKWLEPGGIYEKTALVTVYDAGTFTVTCALTGYEEEDMRDQASTQVTVLPRELPNLLTLDPESTHLYDRSRTPHGNYELFFPPEANPQLLSIPKAYFRGAELAMEIQYSLMPNQISDTLRNRWGWYWELFIFNEGDDYYYPFYPEHSEPRGPGDERIGGGTRPSWSRYFDDQSLISASISKWAPLQEIYTGEWTPGIDPPTNLYSLYPESEGWFLEQRGPSAPMGIQWVALRYLKDAPGRHPVVIRVMFYPTYEGNIVGYEDLWRAWKVGEIVVP